MPCTPVRRWWWGDDGRWENDALGGLDWSCGMEGMWTRCAAVMAGPVRCWTSDVMGGNGGEGVRWLEGRWVVGVWGDWAQDLIPRRRGDGVRGGVTGSGREGV